MQDICVGIVEDHIMFRKAIIPVINEIENCRVILEAGNGLELISELGKTVIPSIILLDLQMQNMNGYETLCWLQKNHPEIHVIILSMHSSDFTIIRYLQAGAKAFLKKNMSPGELKNAIWSVHEKGYYYTDSITRKLFNTLYRHDEIGNDFRKFVMNEKEFRFLHLAATDLTYKEIARDMKISLRAVDKLRDRLFFKFDVKSRVALAMKAIGEGIAS